MAKLVFSGALGRKSIEALAPYAQGLLTGVAEELGLERITVTSTIRSTRAQAEAMYNNIASGRYIHYRKAGQEVTDLCVRMTAYASENGNSNLELQTVNKVYNNSTAVMSSLYYNGSQFKMAIIIFTKTGTTWSYTTTFQNLSIAPAVTSVSEE